MDTTTNKRLSFEQMPDAIAELMDEVRSLKNELCAQRNYNGSQGQKIPVGIERASEITGKAVNTLYRYTSQGLIPCYKKGKTMLFFEDELFDWVRNGKCETIEAKIANAKGNIVQLKAVGSK